MSYYGRRQATAAGHSWRKWTEPLLIAFEDPDNMFDPGLPVRLRPWWTFKAGMVGFWLVCGALGALLAEIVVRSS